MSKPKTPILTEKQKAQSLVDDCKKEQAFIQSAINMARDVWGDEGDPDKAVTILKAAEVVSTDLNPDDEDGSARLLYIRQAIEELSIGSVEKATTILNLLWDDPPGMRGKASMS